MKSMGFVLKINNHTTSSISCGGCGKTPVVASANVTEIIKLSESESLQLKGSELEGTKVLKPLRHTLFNCIACLEKNRWKYPIAGRRKVGRNC
jgi:hypothetical protein